jgi:hypothetical protein
MNIVCPRCEANAIVEMAKGCGAAQTSTGRGRDKKPRIAARSDGCLNYVFWSFAYIVRTAREVRACVFTNAVNEYRTSRTEP